MNKASNLDKGAPSPGGPGPADSLDKAVAAVKASETPRQLKRAMSALTTSSSPRALKKTLERNSKPLADRLSELVYAATGRKNAYRKALRVLRRTLTDLRQWSECADWEATEIAPNVTHFRNPAVPNQDKTLVVGFGGNSQQLMVPSYKVLEVLGSKRCDLLLLRDPQMKFFDEGLNGIGDTPQSVSAFAGAFAADGEYGRVICLATSAGGLMGIYAAMDNSWERVISVGPDDPDTHPPLRDLLANPATNKDNTTQIRVCYSARNDRNSASVKDIAALLPTATLHPHHGPEQHNLLEAITETGALGPYLEWHCFDIGDAEPDR